MNPVESPDVQRSRRLQANIEACPFGKLKEALKAAWNEQEERWDKEPYHLIDRVDELAYDLGGSPAARWLDTTIRSDALKMCEHADQQNIRERAGDQASAAHDAGWLGLQM